MAATIYGEHEIFHLLVWFNTHIANARTGVMYHARVTCAEAVYKAECLENGFWAEGISSKEALENLAARF